METCPARFHSHGSNVVRGGSRGRVQAVRTLPLETNKPRWFIGVEEEQETSAPPPKKILDPPLVADNVLHCLLSAFGLLDE